MAAPRLPKATGQDEIAQLLGETLDEEKAADQKLTEASASVYQQAISEGEENEEDDEEKVKAPAKESAKK